MLENTLGHYRFRSLAIFNETLIFSVTSTCFERSDSMNFFSLCQNWRLLIDNSISGRLIDVIGGHLFIMCVILI